MRGCVCQLFSHIWLKPWDSASNHCENNTYEVEMAVSSVRTFLSGLSQKQLYNVEMAVSSVRTCSSEVDDVAVGSINSSSGELRLSWCPAEPNVGIESPYPEPPLQLEYDNSTYEVTTTVK